MKSCHQHRASAARREAVPEARGSARGRGNAVGLTSILDLRQLC